jgi:non-specific serine/threonine protein kinase
LPLCAAVCREPEVLALLADLQEASLVSSEETETGDVRYSLLETVRTFSRQQAEDAHRYGQATNGDDAPSGIRRRHAECFLAFAQEANSYLQGPDQAEWLAQIETEHDNIRIALDRCLEEPALGQTGLALATALARFWIVRGHWQEGRRRFDTLLQRDGSVAPAPLQARALLGAGMFANVTRDFERAHALYVDALAHFRALGDRAGEAETLHQDAYADVRQGIYEQSRARYEQALTIYREIGNGVGIADELHHLGLVAQQLRDYETARRYYQESLAVRRPLGDLRGLAYSLHNLAKIAMMDGDLARSNELVQESLSIRRRLGDRIGIAESADILAAVAWRQGDEARSRTLQLECLSLYRQLGDPVAIACALERFAAAAVARNQAVRAGSLFGAARAYWRASGTRLPQPSAAERDEAINRVLAGPDREAFQAAWDSLEPLAPEEAAAQALES